MGVQNEGAVSCGKVGALCPEFTINYKYNSQDIRNSSAIFSSAIRYVSSINNNVPVIVGGMSMGGVIARYALAKAEANNNPLPASKFVSIDAPQQGAVVSQSLQDFKKQQQQNAANAAFMLQSLNNDAAKELLIHHTFDPSSSMHNSFYNELNGLNGNGYPHLTENIGVSFSSPDPHNILNQTWLRIDAINPFYQFNIQTFQIEAEEDQAGSFLPLSSTDFDPITRGLFWETSLTLPNLNTIDVQFTRYLNPTFIPHLSSLDIVNGNSKFDKVISTSNTTFHDQVPSDIIEPVINAIIKDNIYVQNYSYNSNHTTIASKNIFAGDNVTNSVPQGNVTVNSGYNVIYKAGESIQLSNGFIVVSGSTFVAKIEQVNCDGINEDQNRIRNNQSNNTSYDTSVSQLQQMTKNRPSIGNIDLHEIGIYPNPTSGNLSVNFIGNENEKNASIEIEDITGKVVFQKEYQLVPELNSFPISISDFTNGIYLVKVIGRSSNIIKTQKIILNKN